MPDFHRYGVFAVPAGEFYDRASAWLGWDSVSGCTRSPPDMPQLSGCVDALTARPRKYGFHGTIKPPFALARGTTVQDLKTDLSVFCASRPAVLIPALSVKRLGGFVAVVPTETVPELTDLAAETVATLDRFRAPPTAAEVARRSKARLSAPQTELLKTWGYPYVMDQFRFHMTLTGNLRRSEAENLSALLNDYFAPTLPRPYIIDNLALMGEASNGRFHLLDRFPLAG